MGMDLNLRRFQSSLCKSNGRGLPSAPLPRVAEQSGGQSQGQTGKHPLVLGEELTPGPPESSWLCMHRARPALTILQLSLTWPCSPPPSGISPPVSPSVNWLQALNGPRSLPSGALPMLFPLPCLGQADSCFPSALHLDVIPFFSCYLFSKYVWCAYC